MRLTFAGFDTDTACVRSVGSRTESAATPRPRLPSCGHPQVGEAPVQSVLGRIHGASGQVFRLEQTAPDSLPQLVGLAGDTLGARAGTSRIELRRRQWHQTLRRTSPWLTGEQESRNKSDEQRGKCDGAHVFMVTEQDLDHGNRPEQRGKQWGRDKRTLPGTIHTIAQGSSRVLRESNWTGRGWAVVSKVTRAAHLACPPQSSEGTPLLDDERPLARGPSPFEDRWQSNWRRCVRWGDGHAQYRSRCSSGKTASRTCPGKSDRASMQGSAGAVGASQRSITHHCPQYKDAVYEKAALRWLERYSGRTRRVPLITMTVALI